MVRTRTANRNRNEEAAAPNPAPAGRGTSGADGAQARSIVPPREPETPNTAAQTAAQPGTAVAVPGQRSMAQPAGRNAFESYGQQMSISSITGTLIKFNKGDWVTGDDEDLEENTELVANMDQLMVGWIKWVDNRPAEQIMGPVAEGYQPPRRNELGDTDQNEWEVDDQGRPRDPWQFSNYIVMKDPGQDPTAENLYTFATSSKGGLGAIGALCREYGKEMRRRPDEYPIVRLGGDSYRHAQYGRTHVPTLTIIGWEPKGQFNQDAIEAARASQGQGEDSDDAPSAPTAPVVPAQEAEPSRAQRQAEPAQRQAAGGRSRRR